MLHSTDGTVGSQNKRNTAVPGIKLILRGTITNRTKNCYSKKRNIYVFVCTVGPTRVFNMAPRNSGYPDLRKIYVAFEALLG